MVKLNNDNIQSLFDRNDGSKKKDQFFLNSNDYMNIREKNLLLEKKKWLARLTHHLSYIRPIAYSSVNDLEKLPSEMSPSSEWTRKQSIVSIFHHSFSIHGKM